MGKAEILAKRNRLKRWLDVLAGNGFEDVGVDIGPVRFLAPLENVGFETSEDSARADLHGVAHFFTVKQPTRSAELEINIERIKDMTVTRSSSVHKGTLTLFIHYEDPMEGYLEIRLTPKYSRAFRRAVAQRHELMAKGCPRCGSKRVDAYVRPTDPYDKNARLIVACDHCGSWDYSVSERDGQ